MRLGLVEALSCRETDTHACQARFVHTPGSPMKLQLESHV